MMVIHIDLGRRGLFQVSRGAVSPFVTTKGQFVMIVVNKPYHLLGERFAQSMNIGEAGAAMEKFHIVSISR